MMDINSAKDASSLWDQGAAGWQHNEGLVKTWLADATRQMLDAARIGTGMTVLDVAAGAGGQTLDIARRVGPDGKVLATDISPRMIDLSLERIRSEGLDQVRCRVADAQAIDLALVDNWEKDGFDAATCRLGLMFCKAPLKALRAIRNCLAPGARFSALVFSNPHANPCIRMTISAANRHLGATLTDPYSPGGLLSLGRPGLMADLLHQAGYVDIEVRPIQAPFRLPRCEDYVDFVRTSGAPIVEMLKSMNAQDCERVWDDITGQLQQFSKEAGWEGPNELLLCAAMSG